MNPFNPQFVTALSDVGALIALIFLSILYIVGFGAVMIVGLRASAQITASAIYKTRTQTAQELSALRQHFDTRFDSVSSTLNELSTDVKSITIELRGKAKPGLLTRLFGFERLED